jgi:hypothetical protein
VAQECEKLAKGGALLAAAAALRVHLTVSGKAGGGGGKAKGDLAKDAEGQARYGAYLRPSSTFFFCMALRATTEVAAGRFSCYLNRNNKLQHGNDVQHRISVSRRPRPMPGSPQVVGPAAFRGPF